MHKIGRMKAWKTLPSSSTTTRAFNTINDAPEAQAFLRRVASARYDTLDDVLAPSIKEERALRGLYATDRLHARLANPFVNLVSVFEAPSDAGINKTLPRNVKDDNDLFAKHVFPVPNSRRRKEGEPSMVDNLAEFQKNWAIFTEGSLSQLADWSNVVAAGGSVLGCLMPMSDKDKETKRTIRKHFHSAAYPASDIDLFIWGLDAEQVRCILTAPVHVSYHMQ